MNPNMRSHIIVMGRRWLAKGRNDEAAREFADAQELDPRLKAPAI